MISSPAKVEIRWSVVVVVAEVYNFVVQVVELRLGGADDGPVVDVVAEVYNSVVQVVGLKLGEADDDPGLCICCRSSSRSGLKHI